MLAAIERIVNAEAAASGAPRPPEITPLDRYPLDDQRPAMRAERVADALRRHFPADRVRHTGPTPASEDFGCFGSRVARTVRLLVRRRHRSRRLREGQREGEINDLPVNHSPFFAPVIHPTLEDRRGSAWSSPRWPGWRNKARRLAKRAGMPLRECTACLVALDLAGTFVFAISGAMPGVRHKLDFFGVLVLVLRSGQCGRDRRAIC